MESVKGFALTKTYQLIFFVLTLHVSAVESQYRKFVNDTEHRKLCRVKSYILFFPFIIQPTSNRVQIPHFLSPIRISIGFCLSFSLHMPLYIFSTIFEYNLQLSH